LIIITIVKLYDAIIELMKTFFYKCILESPQSFFTRFYYNIIISHLLLTFFKQQWLTSFTVSLLFNFLKFNTMHLSELGKEMNFTEL